MYYNLNSMKPLFAMVQIKDYRQPQTKATEHPIKLRVWYDGKRNYLDTDFKFTESDWRELNVANPSKKWRETHKRINAIITKSEAILAAMNDTGREFTFQEFKALYTGRNTVGTEFYDLFDAKQSELQRSQPKTADQYRLSYLSLSKYNGSPVRFKDCTAQFLKDWQDWMLAGCDGEKPRSKATVGMYARCIRHIWKRGIRKGYAKLSAYPFGQEKEQYQIPEGSNDPAPLTPKDIYDLIEYAPISEWENKAKSFWLMSFFCNGMNPKDICLLKRKQLKDETFNFERAKTIRTLKKPLVGTVVLTDQIRAIIEEFGNKDHTPEAYVFPMLNNRFTRYDKENRVRIKVHPDDMEQRISDLVDNFTRYVNEGIKRIWVAMGKPNIPTFYDARDSFATIMRDLGVEPLFIQESLIHAHFSTTQNYLGKFPDSKKRQNSNILMNAISSAAKEQ
jgi:integrase